MADIVYFYETFRNILVALLRYEEENNAPANKSMLPDLTGRTFDAIGRHLKGLAALGLIEEKKEGNRTYVLLTERGRCVARCLAGT